MDKEQSFGKALKQLRESKDINLDQISNFTKINKQFFNKLEKGDFSFASMIYVRLFLREYIKYINPKKVDRIINEFENLTDTKSPNKSLTFLPSTTENEGELTSEQDETNSNSFFFILPKYKPTEISFSCKCLYIVFKCSLLSLNTNIFLFSLQHTIISFTIINVLF